MDISRGKRMVQLCNQSREVSELGMHYSTDPPPGTSCFGDVDFKSITSFDKGKEMQLVQDSPQSKSEASVDDRNADPDFNVDDYLDYEHDLPPDESMNENEVNATVEENTVQVEKSKRKSKLTKEEKINKNKRNHFMKEACGPKCKRNCKQFTEDERRDIWNIYWSLEYISRRKWLAKCVQLVSIQYRVKPQRDTFLKNVSRKFSLQKDNKTIQVCRKFFLNTLGYTNDSVITELSCALKRKSLCSAVTENRGDAGKNVINYDCIKQHINSYNPCISHYRRYDAPNIKYLPRELNVTAMLNDFKSKYPGEICGRETYRKTLKVMNISFNMPKSDSCIECLTYEQLKSADESSTEVEEKFSLHKAKARKATEQYGRDRERPDYPTLKVYSMDLQKVILLPSMPGVKDCYFTSRLVVFNETFVGLKSKSKITSYCSMWHEAMAKRSAQSIVDSILNIIKIERVATDFIFWADNCSAQNKNWFLFTALVVTVNDVSGGPLSINIKYLAKGHTHLTADSINGNIEKCISKVGNVFDYDDLKSCIKKCRKNLEVFDVQVFREWEKKRRHTKKVDDPLSSFVLSEVVEVVFKRNSRKLQYKTDFNQKVYKEVDFLPKKFDITKKPEAIITSRGIQKQKKNTILAKLVQLMPVDRQQFWKDLPESDVANDLVHEFSDNNQYDE